MPGKRTTEVEEIVHRAQRSVSEGEHRYVYGQSSNPTAPSYVIRPNKKAVGRKVSTFYVIVMLFGFGVAIVAYINNIIVVNRLSAEINQLQDQLGKISNGNAVLKAEINKKSAWGRIGKIANEQLGLRYPAEQPQVFEVGQDAIDRATTISAQE